jgi:pimeloyl-ACP methyl ester carboxylesterase
MLLTRRHAAALLACAFAPLPALAAEPNDGLTFEPYAFKLRDGTELPTEKGTFWVREDRGDPRSRRIPIRFLRLKSTSANPGSPIIYLAGGPGGSATGTMRGPRQPVFLALRAVADVIVFDQRGTGLSNSIEPYTSAAPFDLARTVNEQGYTDYYAATLAGGLTKWRVDGVSIRGYTTVESADDMEDLRRHLGARKLNLWGISYGTHLAFAFMRRHAGSVDRVALSSLEGLDQTVKLPANLDKALTRIFTAGRKPEMVEVMRAVHAKFDADPQPMTVQGPGGAKVEFRMDGFALKILGGILPKNPDGIPQLIQLYQALAAGVYQPVADILYSNFLKEPLTMGGMSEAMDIASGITDARLKLVNDQARTALLGRATNAPMPQLRGAISGIDLGDGFRKPLKSDLETLVFSGDLDIRTPLEEQADASAGLSRKQTVLFRNGGHDLFEAHPDVADILGGWFSGRGVGVRELVLPDPA